VAERLKRLRSSVLGGAGSGLKATVTSLTGLDRYSNETFAATTPFAESYYIF